MTPMTPEWIEAQRPGFEAWWKAKGTSESLIRNRRGAYNWTGPARAWTAWLAAKADSAGEWLDIATAPKDGTKFWGEEGEDAIAMFWHPKFEAFVSRFSRMTLAPGYTFEDGETTRDHNPVIHHPKRWRPLPAPPARLVPDDAA